MSYKYMSLIAISTVLLGGCTWQKSSSANPSPSPVAAFSPKPSATSAQITLTEVNKHSTAQDCWFVIDGSVYDVTSYIAGGKHPGGEAIIQGCGKDATQLFKAKPESGKPHSEKANGYLENFKIGELQIAD